MANGDTIKEVRDLLADPQSMTSKTAQRMTLTMLAELYEKYEKDHERTDTLWTAYLWGRWVVLIVAGLGITDIVTKFLQLISAVKP